MAKNNVSVIIPAYNARATIVDCVESTLSSVVKPLEVIVVDDCSNDDTAQIVGSLVVRYPDHVRLLRTLANGGPALGRNIGARAAQGSYYFFIDSDTVMLPGTLENFLKRIQECDAVSGIYHPEPLNHGLTPRYKAYQLAYYFGRRGVFEHDVFIASSAGIRAEAFHAVGGFNEKLPWGMDVENEEFGNRIVTRYRILMDPSINVRHHFPGFSKLTRTYFHRVSLWMELFLKRGRFEKGGNATMGTGLSTAAAAAAAVTLPLPWLHAALWPVPVFFFVWHVLGYAGYFNYVAKRRPSFLLMAFFLNYWFSIVLTSGALYGALRGLMGMGRLHGKTQET